MIYMSCWGGDWWIFRVIVLWGAGEGSFVFWGTAEKGTSAYI